MFLSLLIAGRLTETSRYSLVNTRLTERGRDGSVAERTLNSAAELAEVLEAAFNIESPAPVEAVFAKLASTT